MKFFSKTCGKDFKFLELAILSVAKRCTETVEWTIVCDRGESGPLHQIVTRALQSKAHSLILRYVEAQEHWPDAPELGSGYIQQQWIKMTAHRVMGSSYFLNWDSDVIALRDFKEEDFKGKSGKPIMWFTPFNDLIQGGDEAIHRKRQDYIKNIFRLEEAPFEWMRCMPIWMNGDILRVGEGRPEWMRTRVLLKSSMYDGMSEFNLIGELSHQFFPDAYEYKNTQNSHPTWAGPVDSKTAIVHQGWSWSDVPNEFRDAVLK